MLKTERKPKPVAACAICTQPSTFGFWDVQLCSTCFGLWRTSAPNFEAAELEHAAAHPEDVEKRGEYYAVPLGCTEKRWVILTREAAVKVARSTALAWLLTHRHPKRGVA